MIDDAAIAERIVANAREAFRVLEESVVDVREHCPQVEYDAYVQAAGPILYDLCDKVMNAIYTDHPQLKPSNWP